MGAMATKTAVPAAGDRRRAAVRSDDRQRAHVRIVLDDSARDTGARPAELLGVALAACTAMDVISILRKKRQPVTAYEIRVSGAQMPDQPHAFVRFDVVHVSTATASTRRPSVAPSSCRRARVLLRGSTSPSGDLEIHHAYLIGPPDGDELSAEERLVMGPHGLTAEAVGLEAEGDPGVGRSRVRRARPTSTTTPGTRRRSGRPPASASRVARAFERAVGLEEVRVAVALLPPRRRRPPRSRRGSARGGP